MSDPPPPPSEASLAAANLPDGPHPRTPQVEVPAGGIPVDPSLDDMTTESAAGGDVAMTDAAPTSLPSTTAIPNAASASASTSTQPQPQTQSNAPSPLPARVSTPVRIVSGTGAGGVNGEGGERSRAASAHPDSGFTMPTEAPVHGAPVRQYLNTKVTGVLLEGMKIVAKEQPKDPLRVLGEYLIMRSKEIENSA